LEYIVENYITEVYQYETHQNLLALNINPVVVDNLVMDNNTNPPKQGGKRQAGRPKMQRICNRSKFANPEESTIVCSLCKERGHNAKTCKARKAAKNNNNYEINLAKVILEPDEAKDEPNDAAYVNKTMGQMNHYLRTKHPHQLPMMKRQYFGTKKRH
jgi:hypothetical protein